MSSEKRHTIIVGGGVVGAFCAWYLRQLGRKVTIVDKGEFGAGCSHANCGYVSPSHVLPLAGPGQLAYGLKGLVSSNSALRIRPGLNLTLWTWLLRFGLKCNRHDMLIGARGRTALLESARDLYEQFIKTEQVNVEWRTDGLLFVFRDQHGFDGFAETDQLLRSEFNVAAEPLDGPQLSKLEPALKPGLAGAWHYRRDAHLKPSVLMSELHRKLLEAGVTILPACEVTHLEGKNGNATAVGTADDAVAGDEFVIATGAWTPMLNRELGCRLRIQPGKGYSITMAKPKVCPQYSLLLQEAHVGITPFDNSYRIGSTMEFRGYNSELSPDRLEYLRAGAAEYLIEPTAEPVEEEWFGWRPMTCDGLPYIDRTPRFRNVWVAAGHNMLGLSMGTATGKLISELVTGATPHIDPSPYRIRR